MNKKFILLTCLTAFCYGGKTINKVVKPEDVLSDKENYTVIEGVKLRKGTIAAAIMNARILSSQNATEDEKKQARAVIEELAEALVLVGVYEQLTWKNKDIQEIVETAAKKMGKSCLK